MNSKGKLIYIALFIAFMLIAMGTVWLFVLPVVSYGFGKNFTIKHASDRVWMKWERLLGTHQSLVHEINSQHEDLINSQQRSVVLKDVLQDPEHQHADVALVRDTNLAYLDRTLGLMRSHAEVKRFADELSTQVYNVKQMMEDAKLRNLLIVPEGVSRRFHHMDVRLMTVAEQQQDLLVMDNNLLESFRSDLGVFTKQVDQVVSNSSYFKGIKDSFMVQKIQKSLDENTELQAKVVAKQKKIMILAQKHREQLELLKESIEQYRDLRGVQMQEQRERIRENNELMKERMRDQREHLNNFRDRVNDSQEKSRVMQESIKDRIRK